MSSRKFTGASLVHEAAKRGGAIGAFNVILIEHAAAYAIGANEKSSTPVNNCTHVLAANIGRFK